jgi:hypothetical protein
MRTLSTRDNKLCAALALGIAVVLHSIGIAMAADTQGASTGAITQAGGSNVSSVNSLELANRILNRWQPIAEQLGVNSSAWREIFATQFTMMDASVLTRIDAVTADTSNAKASYAQFAEAVRNAEMQSYIARSTQSAQGTNMVPNTSNKAQIELASSTTDQIFIPIVPCRIVDTRNVGGPISAGVTDNFYFWSDIASYTWANQGGAPGTAGTSCPGTVNPNGGSPSAAAITVTVVSPSAAGNYIIWGGANPIPTVSALNWTGPGQILANTTVVPWGGRSGTGPGGSILDFAVEYNGPSGNAQFVADVVGYFVENQATALDCVTATAPGTIGTGFVFINAASCPAGYTRTAIACETGPSAPAPQVVIAEVGFHGVGYCSFDNFSGAPVSTGVTVTRCCRVPGR